MKTKEEFKAYFGYEMPTNLDEIDELREHSYYRYEWLNYYGDIDFESKMDKYQELIEYLETVLKPHLTQNTDSKKI